VSKVTEMPSFNLQEIEERMLKNPIVNPEDLRVAKKRVEDIARNEAVVEEGNREIAKLRELMR
jgi:hypothetical protein